MSDHMSDTAELRRRVEKMERILLPNNGSIGLVARVEKNTLKLEQVAVNDARRTRIEEAILDIIETVASIIAQKRKEL